MRVTWFSCTNVWWDFKKVWNVNGVALLGWAAILQRNVFVSLMLWSMQFMLWLLVCSWIYLKKMFPFLHFMFAISKFSLSLSYLPKYSWNWCRTGWRKWRQVIEPCGIRTKNVDLYPNIITFMWPTSSPLSFAVRITSVVASHHTNRKHRSVMTNSAIHWNLGLTWYRLQPLYRVWDTFTDPVASLKFGKG